MDSLGKVADRCCPLSHGMGIRVPSCKLIVHYNPHCLTRSDSIDVTHLFIAIEVYVASLIYRPLIMKTNITDGVHNLLLASVIVHAQQYQKQQGNSAVILIRPCKLGAFNPQEVRSSSIDNNTCSLLDFRHPPSTHTLVSSTDTHSPPSTEDTHLLSTNIFQPTSIDTSVRTSIDTEPRDMVATLILVRDERGDLHDQEGHLGNATGQRIDAQGLQSLSGSHWCRSTPDFEHRSTDVNPNQSTSSLENRLMTPTESTASCNAVRIMTHEEFAARHPHLPRPVYVKIDRHSDPVIDRHKETAIDRLPPAPIDRRSPLTYCVQMPKIDVAHLNALRLKPKPSDNPPETIRILSDDAADPMEVDRVPMGLRKRKEKVPKHLKRGANEKERENHLGLQVKPSKESFTFVDCSQRSSGGIVRDLEVQIGNALVPVDFHVLDIKLNWNSSLLLGRAFLSTKPQTSSNRINDPRIIAACHCGAEYRTEYSASIESHTATSIDIAQRKSTDTQRKESVDSSLEDWENDYYNPTMAANTRHTMYTEEYDEDYEKERATEYIATLGKGMRHRSIEQSQHRSTPNLIRQAKNEHQPTLPTTHRSTLESTMYEKETT
ncbi:hypothetical protein F2Q69_00047338 [Brassica cretica]|uniref:Uncharacterized protein n=1 Tax=Brassica cretica TaxID=69181 RepID=A0A8S9PRV5_BRACR|nr:hypothetical protein F2Q69_00047338 [Brassica cretica]